MERATRRAVLASGAAVTAGLAGCLCDGSSDGGSDDEATENGSDGSGTSDGNENNPTGGSDSDGTEDADLDLQEANVTAVAVETEGEGSYRFDVTLYHDDDGEDGYANWWQVETLDGEQLGRRELLHAHGTEEFTRSATVGIPEAAGCVVVRGHDQTHGYGGQAMLVSVASGATEPRRQGSEPDEFVDATCP
ncbi:hypothetical protein [Salinarchaeum laminariae]|uniref:hypothetical protein n=1 Tax=Salinarchaeum laminariae TaxID=869888 RepID=UPI0020BDA504|nr:hypothetical protein [Salinarchaeum laminariae]